MFNTTKALLFGLVFLSQMAFAASSRCYQASIGEANFEGFSAPDTKVTILFAGPSKPSGIAVSAASLGKKGRVNGEFNAGKVDEKNEVHGTLVPGTGELNLTVDSAGVVTHVQPRGKFMANRKTDDSINGVLGTVFGDWGAKIELKPATIEECQKTLYGPLSDAKVAPAAPVAAAPATTTAPPGY